MPYSKLLSALFLLTMITPSASLAQAPKGGKVAANKPASKCSGAWTGVVRYSRKQSMTNDKTVKRVSGRGEDKTSFEMKYEYNATVNVIEDLSGAGNSVGKATITMDASSIEKTSATEKNSCDRGKTWRDMTGEFSTKTKTKGDGKPDANVNVGVNADGTYTVSVGLPPIKGEVSGEQTSSFSGQCTPKEGKTLTSPPSPLNIDGNSLTSDGTHRVNENDPNRISGSYTYTWQNVTETITWNLQKCGAPLRLTDLTFADMKFPTWNDWQEISEQKGTIDGNLVKIKAKVLNASGETKFADLKFKDTYKGDKWDGARPDGLLEGGEIGVRLEAGEEKEVELVWDSSGYAWFDDGRPRLVQRIKAELSENNKKTDEMTKNLKVAPKPLVLVHGLWSNWRAWETWQNILTTSHSYDWKAFPVGEKPEKGLMNTGGAFMSRDKTNGIFENSQELGKYIRYAQQDRNAWHVDLVAHSMGGLISRHYVHHFMPPVEDGRPQVSHLVMLGTPNMGSPCADVMSIAFGATGEVPEAVRQLRQDVVADFNRVTTLRKGVKYSVLAGNPLPTMCKSVVWNDGVVAVPSAKWKIKDNAESRNIHTDLTGTADFSAFVKPRLAIGPKGDHKPEAPDASQFTGRYTSSRVYGAQANDGDLMASIPSPLETTEPFAKSITLAGKQTIEIEIPVTAGNDLGITFMTDPKVSVVLIDSAGKIVGKNESGSAESRGWFRSIYFDKPVTTGTWKLRLTNTGELEYPVIVTSWSDATR